MPKKEPCFKRTTNFHNQPLTSRTMENGERRKARVLTRRKKHYLASFYIRYIFIADITPIQTELT